MADVIIRGVTYSGIDTVSIPADGGGTETFMQPSGAVSITENGVVDVTQYASAAVNVSGGGGGPTASDAILLVTAPANSVVTMTKGADTRVPTMWVSAADPTLEKALFVVEAADFDANLWTVTAVDSGNTYTETVIINSNKYYDVVLSGTPIYYFGDEETVITGGWALSTAGGAATATLVKNADNMVFSTSFVGGSHFAHGYLRTNNKVSLSGVSRIRITLSAYSNTDQSNIPFYLIVRSTDNRAPFSTTSGRIAYVEINATGTFDLDVSPYNDSYFIGVGCAQGSANNSMSATITKIVLL